MLKKTVEYEDPFTGQTVSEDLYFNLTKAELVEMEMGVDGGLKEHLEKIAKSENGQQIMTEMKGIILKAYGRRTDGGQFIKNERIREEFESSEAYSEFFMEMVTNADAAVEFVGGVMPKGMVDEAQQQLDVERPNLAAVSDPKKLAREELVGMNQEDLRSGLAEGRYILE